MLTEETTHGAALNSLSLPSPGGGDNSVDISPQQRDAALIGFLIETYRCEFATDESERQRLSVTITRHIDALKFALGDLENARGLGVLDVACGSRDCAGNRQGTFDPWMSRLLHHLGAQPLGLDIAPQRDERFESRVVDLTRPGALDFLGAHSIDAYYVFGFPNSATLEAIDRQGLSWESVRDSIESALQVALRPTGKVIRGFTAENERWIRDARARLSSQ